MKKTVGSLVIAGIMLWSSVVSAASPYFKAESGVIGLGVLSGNSQGFRIGFENEIADFQIGYTRDEGNLDSDRVLANEATISSVVGEINKKVSLSDKLSLLAGIGAGFSSVNINKTDKADTGLMTTAGIEARYLISKNIYVGLNLKGQFLYVNTTRTDYSSHLESILSDGVPNGDYVEVLDSNATSNGLNLNSGKALITFVWQF